MKKERGYVVSAVIAGLLILAPIYFAILLLLKAMKSVGAIVRPIAMLLPEWMQGETPAGAPGRAGRLLSSLASSCARQPVAPAARPSRRTCSRRFPATPSSGA